MTTLTPAIKHSSLRLNPSLRRNRLDRLFTTIAGGFSLIAVLPLFLVLIYVILQGGRLISINLFTQLPPAPGLDGGGIGNALIGTFVVTLVASMIAIPVGVGGGIFLAEYSKKRGLSPSSSAWVTTSSPGCRRSSVAFRLRGQSWRLGCSLVSRTQLPQGAWPWRS